MTDTTIRQVLATGGGLAAVGEFDPVEALSREPVTAQRVLLLNLGATPVIVDRVVARWTNSAGQACWSGRPLHVIVPAGEEVEPLTRPLLDDLTLKGVREPHDAAGLTDASSVELVFEVVDAHGRHALTLRGRVIHQTASVLSSERVQWACVLWPSGST